MALLRCERASCAVSAPLPLRSSTRWAGRGSKILTACDRELARPEALLKCATDDVSAAQMSASSPVRSGVPAIVTFGGLCGRRGSSTLLDSWLPPGRTDDDSELPAPRLPLRSSVLACARPRLLRPTRTSEALSALAAVVRNGSARSLSGVEGRDEAGSRVVCRARGASEVAVAGWTHVHSHARALFSLTCIQTRFIAKRQRQRGAGMQVIASACVHCMGITGAKLRRRHRAPLETRQGPISAPCCCHRRSW